MEWEGPCIEVSGWSQAFRYERDHCLLEAEAVFVLAWLAFCQLWLPHFQDATSIHTTATLTLKTYPGPAFRLKLSAHEAMSIATAVQAASTFVWDDLDVVSIVPPTAPTYPLPYRPVVMSLGEQLKKRGL